MKTITRFLIPEEVNILGIAKAESKEKFLFVTEHQDKYHYIFHKLHEERYFKWYLKDRQQEGSYIELNMRALQEILGARYAKTIMTDLKEWGLIQCDNYYITEEVAKQQGIQAKSMGYRITSTCNTGRWKTVSIVKPEMREKITQRAKMTLTKAPLVRNIIGRNLRELRIHTDLALKHIEIIWASATAFLDLHKAVFSATKGNKAYREALAVYEQLRIAEGKKHYCKHEPIITCYPVLSTPKDLCKALATNEEMGYTILDYLERNIALKLHKMAQDVRKFQLGCNPGGFFVEHPDVTSRVYTNLTTLSKELRQFIYHKSSQTLVNMDIRNSQPFFFNILLKEYFEEQGCDWSSDALKYKEFTSAGTFYEDIQPSISPNCPDRGQFKAEFFASIFFCEIRHTQASRKAKIFGLPDNYPSVLRIIQEYKASLGDYKQLAITMQRKEAAVMLDGVVKRLYREKIWCSTIHDSIVCLPEDQERVQAILVEAFQNIVGIVPTINPEEIKLR